MSKHEWELAFPYRESDQNGMYRDHFGMTKREYFAASALAGLLAADSVVDGSRKLVTQKVVRMAVDYADALAKELEKPR